MGMDIIRSATFTHLTDYQNWRLRYWRYTMPTGTPWRDLTAGQTEEVLNAMKAVTS